MQADRFPRLFFKFEQSAPADHRPPEFPGRSIDHGGEIQRGARFDLNLLRVNRLPVLIGDETDRRLRGAPDQFPASAPAAHFDREQIPPLSDREKNLIVAGGEGVAAVALFHRRADLFSVEIRLKEPVRGESGTHHTRLRRVDHGENHGRLRADPLPQPDKVNHMPPSGCRNKGNIPFSIRFSGGKFFVGARILEKYAPAGTEPERYCREFLNGNILDHRFSGSRTDLKTEFTALPCLRQSAGREHKGVLGFPRRQFNRPRQPEIAPGIPAGPVGDEDGAARLPLCGEADKVLFRRVQLH